MQGTFYIVGTPIGNLSDMTFRAVETLKNVSLIACEDTRHTIKLLNHFEIKTPMISYHEHSTEGREKEILQKLLSGQDVALVSDAGMPLISDPGYPLVRLMQKECISIQIVPGPVAFISGLCLSGFNPSSFLFLGFLPKAKRERAEILNRVKVYPYTLVFYESPHHLKRTLKDFFDCFGDRDVAIIREITKKFEESLRMSLSEMMDYYMDREPVGEFVVVVSGADINVQRQEQIDFYMDMDINEHMSIYLEKGYTKKDAMKQVAKDRNVSKSDVYKELLQ